jgi:hypothetical protein
MNGRKALSNMLMMLVETQVLSVGCCVSEELSLAGMKSSFMYDQGLLHLPWQYPIRVQDDVYKRAEGIRRGNGKRCSIKTSGRAARNNLMLNSPDFQ